MNQWLNRDFTETEVKMALKQMYTLKALGPDGMPHLSFQKFWDVSGEVVIATVLNFLIHGVPPPSPPHP